MEWSGKQSFNEEPLREWSVDGKKAGLVRSKDGLAFVTIDNAGHMVSTAHARFLYKHDILSQAAFDQPKVALEMINRWLEKRDV